MEFRHTIEVQPGVSVSAIQNTPETSNGGLAVVYAPGAGSDLRDGFGVYLASFLDRQDIECWRFQFPYSERGRKAPDRPPLLEATWQAMIETVSQAAGPEHRVVIGGRSMGGRIASMVAAKGAAVAGLVLFAYPLVPPGRTAGDRTAHFPDITVPTLFLSGTRDNFGTPDQLRDAVTLVPDATLHFLEGADHAFAVLKSSNRTREDIWWEACEALMTFLVGLESKPAGDR